MLKQRKNFRKLIAILVISSILLPSFSHSSIIMANVNESEKDSSGIIKEEIPNSKDDEGIIETGSPKEDPTDDTNQSQGIDGTVQEAPPSLINSTNKSLGQTFSVETNGVKVVYKVLTEDVNSKTGTVQVGTNPAVIGTGILNGATPTDNTLTIPEEVQNGDYTYSVTALSENSLRYVGLEHLNLPKSLQRIEDVALSDNLFRTLIIPEGVTHIGEGCFANNGNLRVLKLPSTLETLGAAILGQTIKQQISVYYPYKKTITRSSTGSNPEPFYGANPSSGFNQTLIITENIEQYNKMMTDSNLLVRGNSGKSCITAEIQLEFYDKDGNSITVDKDTTKLYFQSILWEKGIDDEWNDSFTSLSDFADGKSVVSDFPTLPDEQTLGYKANYWGLGEIGFVTVNGNGNVKVSNTQGGSGGVSVAISYVTTPKMFAVEEELIFTEMISASKGYDGESSLEISFNRNVGNYLNTNKGFSFYIGLIEKGSSNQRTPDFLSNTLSTKLKNVVDSGSYYLTYHLYDKRITSAFFIWEAPRKEISIQVTEGQIVINPQVDKEIVWTNQTVLPSITAKEGDTPGTYTWDANQTPQLGTHTYSYTFVPDNLVGIRYIDRSPSGPMSGNNFTEQSKSGTIEITYKESVKHTVTFLDKDGNVIETKVVEDGKDVIAPIAPNVNGYTFDGWDKPLTNITADTTIKAVYKANNNTGGGSSVCDYKCQLIEDTKDINDVKNDTDFSKTEINKIIAAKEALDKLMKDENPLGLTKKEIETVKGNEPTIIKLYNELILSGAVAGLGWVDVGNGDWNYFEEDATKPTRWVAADTHWYFVEEGRMLRNTWIARDATGYIWYYVNDLGEMVRNTTIDGYSINIHGEWYNNSSAVAGLGWVDVENGDWNYFEEDATKPTRWVAAGTHWYFVEEGRMLRNTWIARDATGYIWYYVNDLGEMVRNTTIDGYSINIHGEWYNN